MRQPELVSDVGERGLIAWFAQVLRRKDRSVLRGIGDDCAVLRESRRRHLLFASDMLVEGVHFRRDAPAGGVGWKALAVNLSDVAAMGGLPRFAVVSLGLPRKTPLAFVRGLYRGLKRCADRFGMSWVGGDTVRAPAVVVDVAILGEVEAGRAVYRSGARPGDHLLVTGRLGGSVRSGRHLRFTPRIREARAITSRARLHAMMDLSDGLAQDLVKLCEASRVGALLESARIPRSPGCSLSQALTDGEDFELLIAAAPQDADRLIRWARPALACGLHRIGRIVPRARGGVARLVGPERVQILDSLEGFEHFKGQASG